jgi:hypothetical protein
MRNDETEEEEIPKLLPTPVLFAITAILLVIAIVGVVYFAKFKPLI